MSFLFKTKNIDSMKIKKFYYYSPDKLKLVQIHNFIPKAIFGLFTLLILFVLTTVVLNNTILKSENLEEVLLNNFTEKKLLGSEIEILKKKYHKLYSKFEKLSDETRALRLAVNLPSLENENENYGIGGSEFNNIMNASFDKRKEKFNSIYDYVNKIETNIKYETSNFEEIKNKFNDNKNLYEVIPAIRPVKAKIGDRFGSRYHPILKVNRMHNGLDFLSNTGDAVLAPGDGIITFIGEKGGYGKVIKIKHGFGYETLYAHLSKFKVKRGQKVKRGDVIAFTGNTGSLSTGPHLHYEVRHNGVCLNPRNFIFENVKLFDNNYLVSN